MYPYQRFQHGIIHFEVIRKVTAFLISLKNFAQVYISIQESYKRVKSKEPSGLYTQD